MVSIIPSGFNDTPFLFGLDNFDQSLEDAVKIIIMCSKAISDGGILVLSTSYEKQKLLGDAMKANDIHGAIPIFMEPSSKEEFKKELDAFCLSAYTRPSILMAIFSGKRGEDVGRVFGKMKIIITVGVPYPQQRYLGHNERRSIAISILNDMFRYCLECRTYDNCAIFMLENQLPKDRRKLIYKLRRARVCSCNEAMDSLEEFCSAYCL